MSKKADRYLGNRVSGNIKVYAPKFPPMTLVKVFLKFEYNIYSDIDFQSVISVSFLPEIADHLLY